MIYVTGSIDFTDYNFFTWAMSTVLEDMRGHTNIDFSASPTHIRPMLHEWINKIQPSMAAYGYNIYYRHTDTNFKPSGLDYKIYFATKGTPVPTNVDKVFTWGQ